MRAYLGEELSLQCVENWPCTAFVRHRCVMANGRDFPLFLSDS